MGIFLSIFYKQTIYVLENKLAQYGTNFTIDENQDMLQNINVVNVYD